MNLNFIKIFHSFDKGKHYFKEFLDDIGKTLEEHKFTLGINYYRGQFFYTLSTSPETYAPFESQFYTYFSNFQIEKGDQEYTQFIPKKTVIGELTLENDWFFPLNFETDDDTDLIYNTLRVFDNFDVINDKVGLYIELKPIKEESVLFYIKSQLQYLLFRIMLFFKSPKYMLNFKIKKNWKSE